MTDQPSPAPFTDPALRRFREYVAAGIAITVIIGTFVLLILAFFQIGNDQNFTRAKDLLLIANPMIGVVIGYYFNKASTEARAENAEATAQSASISAQQAAEARNQATAEASQVKAEYQQTMAVLSDLDQAAEKMLALTSGGAETGVLGASGDTSALSARMELEAAVARARRMLGQAR